MIDLEKKGRSTIGFPYGDLGDAIKVAEGLLKGGGLPMSRDQLGAAMNQAPGSGSFNTKVNTARAFGVMESNGGKYQLTELGFEIVDPARQREAMINAFLNVELYRRTFEEFKGKRLPPRPHGLENAFQAFGVAPKQTANARIAFERSARMAGFFPNGDEDRLVLPFGVASAPEPNSPDDIALTLGGAQVAVPVPAKLAGKPLEYQLIDLLDRGGIGSDEEAAIWTLVRFLKAKAE